jgi:hypothetical protein
MYISGVAIEAFAYLKARLSSNCPISEKIPAQLSKIKLLKFHTLTWIKSKSNTQKISHRNRQVTHR